MGVALGALVAVWSGMVLAAPEGVCQAGGAGTFCRSTADCSGNGLATVCVDSQCAIPCQAQSGDRQPTSCALGETCVLGETAAEPVWFCKASAFAMDLNLLDSCIGTFLGGGQPDLTSGNVCSMTRNLNRMLDQDGNSLFNIFDVEQCVRSYLGQEACTASSCSEGAVFCSDDKECGRGLYCNQSLRRCERECGLVASRESQAAAALERKCSRALTVCDYDHGRCVAQADLAGTTCQVDNECPAGAVCSMGTCAPKCQRSTDCPDSTWYCSTSNRCMPRPTAAQNSGYIFDPQAYSVVAGSKNVTLSAIDSEASVPLLIMDMVSKKQVVANPAVVFGYRLEVRYGSKQDEKCLAANVAPGDINDCVIAADEQFVNVLSPFGVVTAMGAPAVQLSLNARAAEKLTPGLYMATVSAYFSNGGQDSVTVAYRKASPSGLYAGRLSIYNGGAENLLGNTDVSMRLFVDRGVRKRWDSMLAEQGLSPEGDIQDVTEGYFVVGYIDGNDSMVFDQPAARSKAENLIPVRGLYSPTIGRMRLIGAVDIPADFCRTDLGDCTGTGAAGDVRVTNPFGRLIRRVFHFVGPFEERAQRFHGLYREVIHGLVPEARTLEGGFQLSQSKSDESPICDSGSGASCKHLPIYSSAPTSAEFPSQVEVLALVESEVNSYCAAAEMSALASGLRDRGAMKRYLAGLCEQEGGESCERYSSSRMLNQMVRLDGRVQAAVDSMKAGTGESALTLNDYLRGKVVLCEEGKKGQTDCIDSAAARCAMAIHRRALLGGEVGLGLAPRYQAGSGGGVPLKEALFCGEGDRSVVGESCRLNGAKYPITVALQEHNRFYKQLTQATRFRAANDQSDALIAMYRAGSDQLERTQVLSYKQMKLKSALGNFGAMATEMFSPVSASLLFQWPMSRFEGGSTWLKEFHSVLNDRLQVMTSLIDLKRRVLVNSGDSDFAFVQHLMHMEYLSQAYLMLLQQNWEGAEFRYQGQGRAALDQGQAIVSRVTGDKNPLGLHPQQIYFENGNIATSNWKNYRAQISGGASGPGLLAEVKSSIDLAVQNMRASLRDEAAFLDQLQASRQQYLQTIDSLCGAPEEVTAQSAGCEVATPKEREVAMACVPGESGCAAAFRCDDAACSSVKKMFDAATGDAMRGSACDLSVKPVYLATSSGPRVCMRGQMGDLLRQREQFLLQRRQIQRQVGDLMRQAERQAQYIKQTQAANAELKSFVASNARAVAKVDQDLQDAQTIYDMANIAADAVTCMIMIGLANGTDCPQKAITAFLKGEATLIKSHFDFLMVQSKATLALEKEQKLRKAAEDDALRRDRMALDNILTGVSNLVAQYETATSSLFSVNARIADTQYLAEQAVRRYGEQNGSIVQHLVGGMNGDVLLRNKAVLDAEAKFQDLLLATYKLTMAFVHSYNLTAQSSEMVARVFQLMSPDEVAAYLADLDRYEANYCGGAGIDCDSVNNVEVFRFSVRDQLFPGLRDVVDARTGAVLTKGEQFHNMITSDAYVKSRERAGRVVRQIEIPFSVWLNDRGTNGSYVDQWMVSPLECNHIVAAGPSGTVAVNVIGTRLRNLTYELSRGNTDYIRQCEATVSTTASGAVVRDYPINTYIVGYAPQNSLARKNDTPSFVTHSNGFLACKNMPESGGNVISNESCFKYFARERSLGAPDWMLTIPFGVAYDNDWVFGADKAVIEDIVLYVRYRTRPI